MRGYQLRHAAGPAGRGQRQPGGLHQPRTHHHPAQGPLRRRGAHPLPAGAERRAGADRPGGRRAVERRRPRRAAGARPTCWRSLRRFARAVRDAPQVDQRSGVSARFAIAAVETVAASAVRRAARHPRGRWPWRGSATCPAIVPASRGKVEFDDADEGREFEVLEHLLRRAVVETFRAPARRAGPAAAAGAFDDGLTVTTGDGVGAAGRCSPSSAPCRCCRRCSTGSSPTASARAPRRWASRRRCWSSRWRACYLNRRLAKDSDGARTVYGH